MKRDVMKAIREKCMDCCCGQTKEVKMCPSKNCPLYPYRMGKDESARRKKSSEDDE